MKQLFLLIFILSVGKMFSQRFNNSDRKLIVDGYVLDDQDSKPIIKALVILQSGAGLQIEKYSDSTGHYSFALRNIVSTLSITIETSKKTKKVGDKNSAYMASKDIGIIQSDSSKIRHCVKDFELTQVTCRGMWMPDLIFKKNSTTLDTIRGPSLFEEDSICKIPGNSIRFLYSIFIDNPEIIVELNAHCSADEKKPKILAQKRADKIKSELVNLGVNEKRIVAKGYGISRLFIENKVIKKAKTKEEKELLRAKNRRCSLRIRSWDFETEKTIKKTLEEEDK